MIGGHPKGWPFFVQAKEIHTRRRKTETIGRL